MRIERVKGTRDFLPVEMRKRRVIEAKLREIAERWSYAEISTPTFELAELFTIRSGEAILDEMYGFRDRSGRHLALRPELTAPVIRLYVNELKMAPKPIKVYYFGNCFRYEEPQRARYREFWQFGAEIIGSDRPEAEAEIIALAYTIIEELGIDAELHLGHVGLIREILRDAGVSDAMMGRVMRLIDKGARDELMELMQSMGIECDALMHIIDLRGGAAIEEARHITAHSESLEHLEQLQQLLDYYGVGYDLNLGIARGLDYYTGMVFEIYESGDRLGAQRQICGGGTYRLAALFGGDDAPSTGFAFGFDRLAEVYHMEENEPVRVVVVPVKNEPEVLQAAIRITSRLRAHFNTYLDVMHRSLSEQLAYANAIHASYAVIVGKRELAEGKVTLRDLETGEQHKITMDECIAQLKDVVVNAVVKRGTNI